MDILQVEAPQSISDTGISKTVVEELALKVLSLHGEISLAQLSERMCLGLPVIDQIFQFFRREQLCEVKGILRGTHVITASTAGKRRASELLSISSYAGPAPVSLESYSECVREQTVQGPLVQHADLQRAFSNLVVSDDLITRIGIAMTSGASIFLYGPPGTGKTTLACSLPAAYEDYVLIPHAIEIDGEIVSIHDPSIHRTVAIQSHEDSDHRWVLCYRPRVMTGGELTTEMLDLQFNPSGRYFTAPVQLKANNGVLILDDFGRQRMRPDELLNRWMTPLDRRTDFLSLPGGRKFEVPFDVLVVFSTNLDPRSLVDEAFLRRIPNKINVSYAPPEQFMEIFRRECAARMISCDPGLAEYLVEVITKNMKQPLAPSHARDLVNQIVWSANYLGIHPRLSRDALKRACQNYFLSDAKA